MRRAARRARAGSAGIKSPDPEVEGAGEAHPRQIGREQPSGQRRRFPKDQGRADDRQPQQRDVRERRINSVPPGEKRRPGGVRRELHRKPHERPAPAGATPHRPPRHGHQRIQQSSGRSEDPRGRRPRRLGEGRIPLAHGPRRDRAPRERDDEPGGEKSREDEALFFIRDRSHYGESAARRASSATSMAVISWKI